MLKEFRPVPKLSIGWAGNPHFKDCTFRKDAPLTQTHDLLSKLRRIKKPLYKSISKGHLIDPISRL